ncbi:MAG: carboxypeptidase regulatory-like domain-containing protein [Candidatus Acidiferrum sp.]
MKKQGNSAYFSLFLDRLAGAARAFLCLTLAILGVACVANAQDTGYIRGTVTDKTGAAVAGADVVVSSTVGNSTHATTTNGDGAYVVAGLPGGSYNIVVTAKGFQKYTAKNVVLAVGQKIPVDVQLTVGAVTEEVVVTGESVAQVETTSSELGSTITGRQINELELNGRNFTQLVTLTPGVVNQTGQDEGVVGVNGSVAYSINGGRVEYNNWELDGGDNMDNGSNGTLNVYPNPEAIAEVKVLTSNYGAQYGRNGSGTVEVETKSGGSSFHGSAFEYIRNDFFNAKPWESGGEPGDPNPPYKKNDFGYTIGGPIYIPHHFNTDKKKTFFFWSQEWRREKNPSAILQNVPSAAELTGNFSDLCPAGGDFYRSNPTGTNGQPILPATAPIYADCPATAAGPVYTAPDGTTAQSYVPFAGNQVPVTATGQALEVLIPGANTTSGGYPAFAQTLSTPTTWREELIRVDHNITDNYRLTFRYIHDSWQTVEPNPLWGIGTSSFQNINTNFVGPGTSFVARLTANITPTLLNEFVASYTADHIFLTALNDPPIPSGFSMGSLFNNGFGGKLPAISLASNNAYGGGFGQDTGYFPWNNANPTYTYRDNMTKILGTHNLQFGVYFAAAQKNEDNTADLQGILTFSSSSPISTGNAFADMLMGNIAQYQQYNLEAKYYNRYKIVEPYFQDDWRITKRLTLNLGLRVSLFGTYREKYQHAFSFDPGAFSTANEPEIDGSGNLTGTAGALVPGVGNPFNGIVQCGAQGGVYAVTGFPNASVGPSANAGCMQGHLFNPAPRIGFAWDPWGNGKTAVRGGYGIFYEHTNGNEGNTESLEGSAPYALTASQFNVTGYDNIGAAGGLLFPLSLTEIPSKVQWPYVQQWNLDVQRELPTHIVLSVAYVGSKGTHLTLLSNGNQLLPVPAASNPFPAGTPIDPGGADCANIVTNASGIPVSATLGNGTVVPGVAVPNLFVACGGNADLVRTAYPGVSNISNLEDAANSIYNALQVSAQRTLGALTLSVAYTYGHSIDDSSDRYDTAFVNSYDPAANRGSSSFDQRQSLAISYVYALPLFKGASGLKHALLGGWQVSGITVAQTGTPFSVTNGTTYGDNAGVGNGVGTGSRPDLVGNPYLVSQTEFPDERGPVYFNPGAFALPTGLTFGDIGRDTLYLPGRLNFDFGTFKRFAINEKTGFEFRWENFNLFNHTQYDAIDSSMDTSTPGTNLDSSGFMHLDGAHAPRRMQFGLRFYF